jgi:hypothetical protein
MQRLRPLDETECYLRCYGWRGSEESVRVLRREEPPVAASSVPAGPGAAAERIRLAFETMLDSREPEAA